MTDQSKPEQQAVYQIKVEGTLDRKWADWFNGMAITCDGDVTTLTGSVVDQARLRGILSKIWDLNLTLLSVAQVGTHPKDGL